MRQTAGMAQEAVFRVSQTTMAAMAAGIAAEATTIHMRLATPV